MPPTAGPRISYVVARLERAVRTEIDQRVRPLGLTTLQYTALSVLQTRKGLSNAQLARRSYLTPQTMNEVIAILQEKGLVTKSPDPNHGRILRLEVTAAGERLLAKCDREVAEMEEQMLGELSGDERQRFRAALTACVHGLGAGL